MSLYDRRKFLRFVKASDADDASSATVVDDDNNNEHMMPAATHDREEEEEVEEEKEEEEDPSHHLCTKPSIKKSKQEEQRDRAESGKEIQEFYKSLIATDFKQKSQPQQSKSKSTTTAHRRRRRQQQQQEEEEEIAPQDDDDDDDNLEVAKFFCPVCEEWIGIDNWESHPYSTLHLFNASSNKEMPPVFGIPEWNIGYQMLSKKMGWTEDTGLGVDSQGRLYPIKTRLKNDKLGLGAANPNPLRITHYPSVHATDAAAAAAAVAKSSAAQAAAAATPKQKQQQKKLTREQEVELERRKEKYYRDVLSGHHVDIPE